MSTFTKKSFRIGLKYFFNLKIFEDKIVKIKIILREVHSNITCVITFVFKQTFLRKINFHFAEQLGSASRHFGKTRESIGITYAVQKTKKLRAAVSFPCWIHTHVVHRCILKNVSNLKILSKQHIRWYPMESWLLHNFVTYSIMRQSQYPRIIVRTLLVFRGVKSSNQVPDLKVQ